jgi:hypothetical protein
VNMGWEVIVRIDDHAEAIFFKDLWHIHPYT